MKYERLTPEILLSDVVKGYNLRDDMLSKTFGGYNVIELIDRLVELENKIERGELVEVPKGAVVLTPEEKKQAVKEFAERVKMAFYYEFDELIPSIMADKIDELVKEVCGE